MQRISTRPSHAPAPTMAFEDIPIGAIVVTTLARPAIGIKTGLKSIRFLRTNAEYMGGECDTVQFAARYYVPTDVQLTYTL